MQTYRAIISCSMSKINQFWSSEATQSPARWSLLGQWVANTGLS